MDQLTQLMSTSEGRRALSSVSPRFFDSYYLSMKSAKHRNNWLETIETTFNQAKETNDKKRMLVLAPRSHGKSLLAISFCLRQICMNRNTSILFISASAGQAEKRVRLIKQFLDSEKILEDWATGDMMPFRGGNSKWTGTEVYVNRQGNSVDPTLQAIGVGGKVTGAHVDIIVLDDLEDDTTVGSPGVRAKTREWLGATVMPILNQGGMLLTIGTRKHEDDLYAHMLGDPTFQVIQDNAIIKWPESFEYKIKIDNKGRESFEGVDIKGDYEVLWPEFRPIDYLLMERRSMGSHLFAREMQNEVVSEEDAIVQRSWMESAKRTSFTFDAPPPGLDLSKCVVVQSWDLSIVADKAKAQQKDTDYTAGITLARDPGGIIYILDVFHKRGITQSEILNAIMSMYEKWETWTKEIWVEKNSFGNLYISQLRKTSLPVKGVQMNAKNALRNSIHNIAILFENEYIRLPYGDNKSQQVIDKLIEEAFTFPRGRHDDLLDSLSHGLAALKKDRTNYQIAIGDTVLDQFGNNTQPQQNKNVVQSVLSEMGIYSGADDDIDPNDSYAQRFLGFYDD